MAGLGRRRSGSPEEKAAPKPRRSRANNDLLGSSPSTERVLRKQKGVEKARSSSSSSSSSSSDEDKRPGVPVLREPVRGKDAAVRQAPSQSKEKHDSDKEEKSSICEELDRDPISIVQDSFKKEELKKQRHKEMEYQSTEHRSLDAVINSVADEQARTEDPKSATPKKKKKTEQYSNVGPKVLTRPRSALTSTESSEGPEESNFNDSLTLRQSVYDNWYRTKLEQAKIKRKQDKQKQKEEEERKKKEENDKLAEKKANFDGWIDRKKSFFDEQEKKRRDEMKKKKEEEEEKKRKERESEKYFNDWKEKKGEKIKEAVKEKRRDEHRKRIEADEEKKRREKDVQRAFESWKDKKDSQIKSNVKDKRKSARSEEKTKEQIAKEKEEQANKAFEEWEKKQSEREMDKYRYQKQTEDLQLSRRAWRPSSRTVIERR